jgi:hypothetical protein
MSHYDTVANAIPKTSGVCHPENVEAIRLNDPSHVWCRIQGKENVLRLVKNLTGRDITQEAVDKMLGMLSTEELWNKIGIKTKGRKRKDVLLEVEKLKDSGEYFKRIKNKKITHDPNAACKYIQTLIPETKYTKGWKVVKVLGSGEFGTVILLQKGIKFRAVKFMIPSDRDWVTPIQEYHLQEVANKIGIAPKVLAVEKRRKSNRTMYITVQGIMDMDFVSYLKCVDNFVAPKYRETYYRKIFMGMVEVFILMQKYTFTHGDMHPGNIMFKRMSADSDAEVQLELIDFGQSSCKVFNPFVDVSQFLRVLKWEYPSAYSYFKKRLNVMLLYFFPDKSKWPSQYPITGKEFDKLHDAYSENIGCPQKWKKKVKAKSKPKPKRKVRAKSKPKHKRKVRAKSKPKRKVRAKSKANPRRRKPKSKSRCRYGTYKTVKTKAGLNACKKKPKGRKNKK